MFLELKGQRLKLGLKLGYGTAMRRGFELYEYEYLLVIIIIIIIITALTDPTTSRGGREWSRGPFAIERRRKNCSTMCFLQGVKVEVRLLA